MRTRSQARSPFENALHGAAGQLVERVAALPRDAARPQLLRWLLAIGAVFIAWRLWRVVRKVFWIAFALAMALFWSGAWHRWA